MNKTNRLPVSDMDKTKTSAQQISTGHDNSQDKQLSSELQIRISFGISKIPTALLTLKGNIVQSNLKLLRSAFDICLSKRKNVIILSMKEITSVSVAGWEYLLKEQEKLKSHNTIVILFGIQSEVYISLTAQKFFTAFKVFPTLEECHKEIEKVYAQLGEKSDTDISKSIKPSEIISEKRTETVKRNSERKNTATEFSVEEKIGAIIAQYGPCSFFELFSHLRSAEFEKEKIGFIKLFFVLRDLDLDSQKKRERFYRSC